MTVREPQGSSKPLSPSAAVAGPSLRHPQSSFWLEEHDVFASDQHVCAVGTMDARRDGGDVQTRVVHVFRYRQGQQVERWLYPDEQPARDSIFQPLMRGGGRFRRLQCARR